jgi:Fe-S cluster assembly iron-binding protein IscA
MLEVTDGAAKRMRTVLSQVDQADDLCFRITVTEEGVNLTPDQERPEDTAIKHDEQVVLVMDRLTADLLEDHKLDYDEATSQLFFA